MTMKNLRSLKIAAAAICLLALLQLCTPPAFAAGDAGSLSPNEEEAREARMQNAMPLLLGAGAANMAVLLFGLVLDRIPGRTERNSEKRGPKPARPDTMKKVGLVLLALFLPIYLFGAFLAVRDVIPQLDTEKIVDVLVFLAFVGSMLLARLLVKDNNLQIGVLSSNLGLDLLTMFLLSAEDGLRDGNEIGLIFLLLAALATMWGIHCFREGTESSRKRRWAAQSEKAVEKAIEETIQPYLAREKTPVPVKHVVWTAITKAKLSTEAAGARVICTGFDRVSRQPVLLDYEGPCIRSGICREIPLSGEEYDSIFREYLLLKERSESFHHYEDHTENILRIRWSSLEEMHSAEGCDTLPPPASENEEPSYEELPDAAVQKYTGKFPQTFAVMDGRCLPLYGNWRAHEGWDPILGYSQEQHCLIDLYQLDNLFDVHYLAITIKRERIPVFSLNEHGAVTAEMSLLDRQEDFPGVTMRKSHDPWRDVPVLLLDFQDGETLIENVEYQAVSILDEVKQALEGNGPS